MKAKPIFLIRIPKDTFDLDNDKFEDLSKQLQLKLPDYHVLVMVDNRSDSAVFECFNATDAKEVDIEEIKAMIRDSISNL
jgi:hypothetical protein